MIHTHTPSRPRFAAALLALILALGLLSLASMPASGQNAARPEQAIERLFAAPIQQAWFTPAFLKQVPLDRMAGLLRQLQAQHGAFESVKRDGRGYMVSLQRARVPTRLVLDTEGRIAGLWFEAPIIPGSLQDQVAAIAALPGQTAVLVLRDDAPMAAHRADTPLAVGSTAKLAILKAVAGAVAQGKMAWDQAVPLDPAWRSLPTGILQDWPAGTPITVASLANLMISISDNTATDALIWLAGRDAIQAVTPRNTPFMTTRELFTMKAAGHAGLRSAWVAGDPTGRRALLDGMATAPLPDAGQLEAQPTIDVEWYLSVREACALITELAVQPALHINPGLAAPAKWARIAYKGGSEPGVLNFTIFMQDPEGTRYCVSASWNNPAAVLDDQALAGPYRAILDSLQPGG
ncbi:serine hydrolase [Bordetella sp. BOR01]|uniref:serine hydrolase n=1 Tax=Bordetella sp. BOR01 TaxID=2854779 RepID=UPI001C45B9CD|nr:serine hydrolase [Bordetella sp. BOR01]MBV7486073.1 serine hydrolase [Bordetella sp. BOR01]